MYFVRDALFNGRDLHVALAFCGQYCGIRQTWLCCLDIGFRHMATYHRTPGGKYIFQNAVGTCVHLGMEISFKSEQYT